MTEMGACWRKRSKVSPSCMAAVPGLNGYPEERQQVIENSTTLEGVTALTYLAVHSGSPGDVRDRPVVLTTLATITGPFTGAIARNGQGCCLESSAFLASICGPVLAVGLLAQVVPLPFNRGQQAMRLVLWSIGWVAWLSGGLVSFGHALSWAAGVPGRKDNDTFSVSKYRGLPWRREGRADSSIHHRV